MFKDGECHVDRENDDSLNKKDKVREYRNEKIVPVLPLNSNFSLILESVRELRVLSMARSPPVDSFL